MKPLFQQKNVKRLTMMFLIIFGFFTFLPGTMCLLVDDELNFSVVYSLNEEENKGGENSTEKLTKDSFLNDLIISGIHFFSGKSDINYFAIPQTFLEDIYYDVFCPPPEQV